MMKSRFLRFLLILFTLFTACARSGQVIQKGSGMEQSASVEMGAGTAFYNSGCYRRALVHFYKAHELFSAIDQPDGAAMSLNNIGNVYRIINDPESAILFFDEAFDLYMEINNPAGAVQALSNKSAALIADNRLDDAEKILHNAEELAKNKKVSSTPLMHNRSILLIKQKKYAEAEQALLNNLKKTNNNSDSKRAVINFALGNVMSETGRYEEAISFYLTALDLDRKTGFHRGIADDLEAVGKAYVALNKDKEAINYLKRSIKIYALMKETQKVEEIMAEIDAAAEKAGISTTVIRAFVNDWLSNTFETSLCE